MTDKLLSLAREVGAFDFQQKVTSDPTSYVRFTLPQLTAFAERIRQDERERAARICEEQQGGGVIVAVAKGCAAAIRSSGLMNERESQEQAHQAAPSGNAPTAGLTSQTVGGNTAAPTEVDAPLPCPFCGGADIFIQEETMEWPAETWKVFGYTIGCNLHTGCGITHFAETREAAIAAWNRRAPSGHACMEDGA